MSTALSAAASGVRASTGAIPAMNEHMVAIGVDDPVLTHVAAIEQFLRRPDDDDARAGPAGFPA
ncbi:MAG TPA: hypothetical protein VFS23_40130 [Vicinamibacterales bacterium]|nr:hypothetical protein [Vicinamibacterales bacterium]